MKRIFYCTTICSLIFAFSSQAFAVAMTASGTALTNTKKIVRDCTKTTDPNVKYRCEVAAAKAEAKAEEKAAKKKQEMIATGLAGLGAVGAFMNMRKDNAGSDSSSASTTSTTRASTSNGTGFETAVSTQTPAATSSTTPVASSTSTTAASNPSATAPPTSPRPNGRAPSTDTSNDADSQTVMVSHTTSISEHQCSNNVTTANISGACKGTSNIMIDISKSCMCIGEHCFDIQIARLESSTADIIGVSELTQGAGGLINFRNPTGGRRIGVNQTQQGVGTQRGINLAPAAFTYLNQAIQDSRGDAQLRSMKICSGEGATNMAAAQPNARPQVQLASASTGRTARSSDTVIAQQQVTPVQSKLTQRMNYAVKVRNQFAPAVEADSIN
jgi:hypothetical protein